MQTHERGETSRYCDGTYLEQNPDWHEGDSVWKARPIHAALARNGLAAQTIAEVGCGAGRILYELANMMPDSCEFSGYAISPQAIQRAEKYLRPGLTFNCIEPNDDVPHCDILLMIDVFEHVEDYVGFIRRYGFRGRHAIFHIPLDLHVMGLLIDHQIKNRDRAGNLHYFSKATALRTLTDVGFEIVEARYTNYRWNSKRGNRYSPTTVALALPRILSYAISPDWSGKLMGGASLLVVAKPPR